MIKVAVVFQGEKAKSLTLFSGVLETIPDPIVLLPLTDGLTTAYKQVVRTCENKSFSYELYLPEKSELPSELEEGPDKFHTVSDPEKEAIEVAEVIFVSWDTEEQEEYLGELIAPKLEKGIPAFLLTDRSVEQLVGPEERNAEPDNEDDEDDLVDSLDAFIEALTARITEDVWDEVEDRLEEWLNEPPAKKPRKS